MPQQQPGFEREMGNAQRKRDQIWKQREMRMGSEKFLSHWEQLRMQDLLHARQIDFRILGERMIAVNQKSARG